jgi:hypothetical protein
MPCAPNPWLRSYTNAQLRRISSEAFRECLAERQCLKPYRRPTDDASIRCAQPWQCSIRLRRAATARLA